MCCFWPPRKWCSETQCLANEIQLFDKRDAHIAAAIEQTVSGHQSREPQSDRQVPIDFIGELMKPASQETCVRRVTRISAAGNAAFPLKSPFSSTPKLTVGGLFCAVSRRNRGGNRVECKAVSEVALLVRVTRPPRCGRPA
jgi:hypothetical protein